MVRYEIADILSTQRRTVDALSKTIQDEFNRIVRVFNLMKEICPSADLQQFITGAIVEKEFEDLMKVINKGIKEWES